MRPRNCTVHLGPHSEDIRRMRAWAWVLFLLVFRMWAMVSWAHSLLVNLKQEQEFKTWK